MSQRKLTIEVIESDDGDSYVMSIDCDVVPALIANPTNCFELVCVHLANSYRQAKDYSIKKSGLSGKYHLSPESVQ